jgi:hypothetical protein
MGEIQNPVRQSSAPYNNAGEGYSFDKPRMWTL